MKLRKTEIHGFKLFLRPDTPDEMIAQSSLGDEFSTICELLSRSRAPKLVLDLGGYIGTAALYFSKMIPNCTVISLEPSPENFMLLQLNTAGHKNIIPIQAAVGVVRTKAKLYNRHTGEWGHTLIADPDDCPHPTAITTVDVMTMDDILSRWGKGGLAPALVKLDIEGYEYHLLKDPEWLRVWPIVAMELHERIRQGCIRQWEKSCCGADRLEVYADGEKRASVNPDLLLALHAPETTS